MAEGDVSLLISRLTSYSEALDRHNAAIQRAYETAQESLANLRHKGAGRQLAVAPRQDWPETSRDPASSVPPTRLHTISLRQGPGARRGRDLS